MLEPPVDLANETLDACLRDEYGLAVAEIAFLPIGHDPFAWVYRVVAADGRAYFLKARMHITNEASLLVPHHLHAHGVTQVVAPLATLAGTLWTSAGRYAVIVYPYVESVTGMAHGMSPEQWIEYGRVLRQVHETAITPELAR